MKHLFIVNPIAGKGKALEFIPQINKLFKEIKEEYFIEITNRAGHATEIVRSYVKNGSFRVYSIGGDGTLNEVLNGMVGSDSALAVIPGGSGNDFFRSICSGKKADNLLYRTIRGSEKSVDIARVNERYFINISSVGFDAETAFHTRLAKRLPFVKGSTAYLIGILITIIKNRKYKVEITYNGDSKYTGRILLAAIANGRYYGGGILPAPEARLDDGKLDICIVKALGRLKILWLLPLYMKGKHLGMKEVLITKSDRIEISCDREIPLNIDGEVILVNGAVFEILPQCMKIVIPNKSII